MSCERFRCTGVGRENDLCISKRYVISMLDNIFVFQASVFTAQAQVENDCGISETNMRWLAFLGLGFRVRALSSDRGRARAMDAFQ